jgi:hypothetical protein
MIFFTTIVSQGVRNPHLLKSRLLGLEPASFRARKDAGFLEPADYLLLHGVLSFYADIHNSLVTLSRSKQEKKKASFVDPFLIDRINLDDLIGLYFFDVDFLYDEESLLNLPGEFKRSLRSEAFGLSLGLLPHPEELVLEIDSDVDPQSYKISSPNYFGPKSKVYPDFAAKGPNVNSDCR